jgi:type II secretory ATPase GspE/PulE/Tfp pilus assembly ATPase PilB-like protein
MLLVTGPTGSGKTTTLYAALQRRQTHAEKIITVEDPIEYQLSGVTQVPVHRQAGVTFGSALRSILRQDPDVIMVGEMRDGETAEIAIQAAMTGHLVFSTLHTNDAIATIPRLLDLGVPGYLVGATLEAVLAQRLVRRICDACRVDYRPSPESVAQIAGRPVGRAKMTKGAGCARCGNTGFRGRVGVFELLVLDDTLKDAIVRGVGRTELRTMAEERGMRPLRADGWTKAEAGLTTVEEVLRVVQQ